MITLVSLTVLKYYTNTNNHHQSPIVFKKRRITDKSSTATEWKPIYCVEVGDYCAVERAVLSDVNKNN